MTETGTTKNDFYPVEVWSGTEKRSVDELKEKSRIDEIKVRDIIYFEGLKGYIFIKTDKKSKIDNLIKGIKTIRSRMKDPLDIDDVMKYIETEPMPDGIEEGSAVEVIAGPFKGMKAELIRTSGDEATIQLFDSNFQMPLKLRST